MLVDGALTGLPSQTLATSLGAATHSLNASGIAQLQNK